MKTELFIEKLFTEEIYIMSECGSYIYHSIPDKPFGWRVWRKTIGQGKEQLYNWKEDVGPGCWWEAVMMRFLSQKSNTKTSKH